MISVHFAVLLIKLSYLLAWLFTADVKFHYILVCLLIANNNMLFMRVLKLKALSEPQSLLTTQVLINTTNTTQIVNYILM